jgi:hypothetical protein
MADSDTGLFVFLVIFWTLLTIFSNVFINYLEEPISDNINDFVPDSDNLELSDSETSNFMAGLYNFLSEVPIINAFVPLAKILTFGYSDKIPGLIVIFLDATMILTYYVVWGLFKR